MPPPPSEEQGVNKEFTTPPPPWSTTSFSTCSCYINVLIIYIYIYIGSAGPTPPPAPPWQQAPPTSGLPWGDMSHPPPGNCNINNIYLIISVNDRVSSFCPSTSMDWI